jgi:hypothetical protein
MYGDSGRWVKKLVLVNWWIAAQDNLYIKISTNIYLISLLKREHKFMNEKLNALSKEITLNTKAHNNWWTKVNYEKSSLDLISTKKCRSNGN